MLKAWLPPVALLGGGGTFRRWGLLERKLGHWGHALEGLIGTLALSCVSLYFLATIK
jgi:hypothetical protein